MRAILIVFLVLSACVLRSITAEARVLSCPAFFAERQSRHVYRAGDIPSSSNWSGVENGEFPVWMARTANEAAALFGAGQSFASVLSHVAESRRAFQNRSEQHGDRAAGDSGFGIWRLHIDREIQSAVGEFDLPGGINRPTTAAQNQYARLFLERMPDLMGGARDVDSFITRLRVPGTFSTVRSHTTFVGLRNGRQIGGSTFVLYPQTRNILIMHPAGPVAQIIFSDLQERAQGLIHLRERSGRVEFALAMHAYFNAMPFIRGSAAIGRAVFSGLHLYLFNTQLRAPHDVDIQAMSLSPDAFVAKFVGNEL